MPFPFDNLQGNKIMQLSKPVYLATQRALKSIWFGQVAPIDEAVECINREEGVRLTKTQVLEVLADYVNLIVRQLETKPDSIGMLATSYREHLAKRILAGQEAFKILEQEARNIEQGRWAKEKEVKALRARVTYLESQERSLRRRKAEHEQKENEIQRQLAEIAEIAIPSLDGARQIAIALAEEATQQDERE